jgi:hypothetical protein
MRDRTPPTPEEFAALLKRTGLELTPAHQADLRAGYIELQRHLPRLRRANDPALEPAMVFRTKPAGQP